MAESIVTASYWAAALLDVAIVLYAWTLTRRMGGSGLLRDVTVYAGLSALVFGLHHLGELYMGSVQYGLTISEGLEGVAALLLGVAVYKLYALTQLG